MESSACTVVSVSRDRRNGTTRRNNHKIFPYIRLTFSIEEMKAGLCKRPHAYIGETSFFLFFLFQME